MNSSVKQSRSGGAAKRGTTLVFLYGPPAVGKLTVAKELAKLTGYRNFHNQLTVDLVNALFDWGTPTYVELVKRFRLGLLSLAAKQKVRGIIYTYAYCSQHDNPNIRQLLMIMRRHRVRVCFVRLTASLPVLLRRVRHEFRRRHDKIVSQAVLKRVLREHDFSTPVPFGESYTVDTSKYKPIAVARSIVKQYKLTDK